MTILTLLLLSALPVLVIAAGLLDLTTMTIPNRISLILILAFFPAAFAVGLTPMAIAAHAGVAALALVIGVGLFALRLVGGGDAKLIAATSLWMGMTASFPFVFYTAMVGGLLCLTLLVARPMLKSRATPDSGWLGRLMQPKGDVPYGVAIAVGALAAFPSSRLFTTFAATF